MYSIENTFSAVSEKLKLTFKHSGDWRKMKEEHKVDLVKGYLKPNIISDLSLLKQALEDKPTESFLILQLYPC